ncbi:MarR family winged helix-turn-helix transcriptional regulator [Arthrobacter sp. STN4]|uniref:MarR family winged helix-turn-helix transcriptional regulator n=1 Tax=Arthrobacter sp. STN4 TaxID=2923276 RepID=UPI00211A31A6|nr:MarR family winged helix-turn-helix transcriptional regulator [Arthrobacter sp. STN4]MCQ9165382.1 MarR family winged helix-turn-helix transcriptional regulator [Arthrobacter sp. STN4]
MKHPLPDPGPTAVPPNTSMHDRGVHALEMLARDVVGMTLHSLNELEGPLTGPQFRLLLTLDTLGTVQSSRAAAAMGVAPSSVSRLAERLAASGHIERGSDTHHRSVVTLELSALGKAVVERVTGWRKQQLARMLAAVPADRQAGVVDALELLYTSVANADDDALADAMAWNRVAL